LVVEETALELIALTYDAVLASERWPAFMERLVKVVGARSALLREVEYNTGAVGLFETVGYDPAYVAAYRKYFVRLDIFAEAFVSLPIGAIRRGDEVVPWERQRKTEFYNDYFAPLKIRHVLGGTLSRNQEYQLQFAMQREPGQGDFDEEDMRLIRLVTPHMARAAQIYHQVAEVTDLKQWALSALDSLRIGVILLDGRGEPVHLNRAADRLVAGRHGLTVRRHGLSLHSATETAKLRSLIDDAARVATGKGIIAGDCLRVRSSGGGEATLQFQVIPLPRDISEHSWRHSLTDSCVAVFISTPGGPRLPWQRVADMHGLTRAEARLASLLAEGISLEEAAEALLVSVQTVRSHLKSVFSKTGVTRQAELVALLLTDMLATE